MLSRVFYVDSVKVWGCPRCPKRWVGPLLVYSVGCLVGVARGSAAGLFCPSAGCGGLEGFLEGGAAAFSHERSGGNPGRLGRRYESGKLPLSATTKKWAWASHAAERMRNRDAKAAAASVASPGSLDGSLHSVAARMAR